MRKQYSIAIKRQKGVFALKKLFEIECVAYTDGRTVVAVTPCDPVTVFDPSDTGIILVFRFYHIGISCFEFNGLMFDVPMNTVFAESCKDIHLHGFVIATEYSGEPVFKRYYGTVKDAVGRGDMVAVDYRIFRITPHDVRTSCRTVFPGHNHFFCHIVFSFLMYMCSNV